MIANQGRTGSARRAGPPTGHQLTAAAVFAAFTSELADAPDLNQILATVLEFGVRTMRCDWATIRLQPRGHRAAAMAVSDSRFAQSARQDTGDWNSGEVAAGKPAVLTISDTALDQRWPQWSAELLRLGVRSAHVVDLDVGGSALGTIAFYAAHPGSWAAAEIATARLLAVHAALAIAVARQAADLSEAVETRTLIGRAQGILMERFAVDSETALAVLRSFSQDNYVRLRDVAQSLITTRRLPGEQPAVISVDELAAHFSAVLR